MPEWLPASQGIIGTVIREIRRRENPASRTGPGFLRSRSIDSRYQSFALMRSDEGLAEVLRAGSSVRMVWHVLAAVVVEPQQ